MQGGYLVTKLFCFFFNVWLLCLISPQRLSDNPGIKSELLSMALPTSLTSVYCLLTGSGPLALLFYSHTKCVPVSESLPWFSLLSTSCPQSTPTSFLSSRTQLKCHLFRVLSQQLFKNSHFSCCSQSHLLLTYLLCLFLIKVSCFVSCSIPNT